LSHRIQPPPWLQYEEKPNPETWTTTPPASGTVAPHPAGYSATTADRHRQGSRLILSSPKFLFGFRSPAKGGPGQSPHFASRRGSGQTQLRRLIGSVSTESDPVVGSRTPLTLKAPVTVIETSIGRHDTGIGVHRLLRTAPAHLPDRARIREDCRHAPPLSRCPGQRNAPFDSFHKIERGPSTGPEKRPGPLTLLSQRPFHRRKATPRAPRPARITVDGSGR